MRKIIAVLVVFALVAGAAFAETSISGSVSVRAQLLSMTIRDDDVYSGSTKGEVETAYINLSGENDEGTFGGLIRLRGNDGRGAYHRAYTYWRPIPQLEIFLGQDVDGKFAPYNAWSHFQGQEGYQHIHDWGAWRQAMAFTNWDDFGLAFTLKPIPGLAIDLVVPFGGVGSAPLNSWEATYADKDLRDVWGGSLQLTASFAIPDIGTVYFGLKGPGSSIFIGDPDQYGRIGLTFQLSAIQGLDLLAGFSTNIPGEVTDQPVYIALMANYSAGDFGIKTRWRVELAGTRSVGTPATPTWFGDLFELGFDIQPYYSLGAITVYLNIGFVALDYGVSGRDPVNQLIINPYIRMGFGAGSIRLGLLYVDPNLDVDNDATLKVPVTFGFSF